MRCLEIGSACKQAALDSVGQRLPT